jgi:hypothetical protein
MSLSVTPARFVLLQPATAASIADVEGPVEPGVIWATTEEVVALGRSGAGEDRAIASKEEMDKVNVRDFILTVWEGFRCLVKGDELMERIVSVWYTPYLEGICPPSSPLRGRC